jgi:hypothetical protein
LLVLLLLLVQGAQLHLRQERHLWAAALPHQLQALLLLLGQPWVLLLVQLQALLVLLQLLLLLHLLWAAAGLYHQLAPVGWESVQLRMRLHNGHHKVAQRP